jgi:hypothetical protein
LTEFSNQSIYIAFVHSDITNVFAIKIDDIQVVDFNFNKTIETNSTFEIYPNPADNFLYISELNNFDCEIYDLNGKLIIKNRSNGNSIDISELNSGMFYLKVISNNFTFSRVFIKR